MMYQALIVGVIIFFLGPLLTGEDRMEPSPTVPLNHFYIVLDSATYRAIETDEFLRNQFAVSEQRTTVRTDRTYTGVYFYGTNTYFEFFDVAEGTNGRVGDSGIAFGVDQPDALKTLGDKLASEFRILPEPITRQYKNAQVPWFFMAVPKTLPAASGLSLWIMEYHPRFLAEWNPDAAQQNQGVSRKQILQRYAAVLKKSPDRPYLQDVVGLTIALDKSTATKLIELCRLLGYRSSVEGQTTLLEGPQIRLRLITETVSARGIHEITMRVKNRPARRTEFNFGKAILKFRDDGLATWSFRQ
jgi:hypothetical protein